MSERVKKARKRVIGEISDIYEYELKLQRDGVRQHITVVRSRIEQAYEELEGIMKELMEDPMYYEMAEGILNGCRKNIDDLRALEERLCEELELLECHMCSIELVNSYRHS